MNVIESTRPILEQERDDKLDDLLSRWHHWSSGARVTRGHANRSLVAGDYITSRQYDDENGALDDAIESRIMRGVESVVERMEDPFRAAIYVEARALCLGVSVFRSPRLPEDPREARKVIDVARGMLVNQLTRAGLM